MVTCQLSTKCRHHNFIKVKALLVISRQTKGVTSSEIAWQAGVYLKSLRVLIIRWVTWGYVSRQRARWYRGREDDRQWLYYLTAKGRDYIKRLPDWYPHLAEAAQEIDRLEKIHNGVAWYDGKRYHIITPPFATKEDYLITTDHPQITLVGGPESLFKCVSLILKRNYLPAFRDYVINRILEIMPKKDHYDY